jgi:diguanylate cyclase (GGDEF)-like protein/PAS domain S-box-containing protein
VRFGDQEFNIAYIKDITARNKQNEQLHLAQFAMEHSPVEIFWLDKDARIEYVNKYACDTLGYTREELKALSIPELDPLFPVDEWQAHWEGLKQSGPQHFETQHRRKDGSVIPVEVSANYVKFGQHEYNVAFSYDLTERKKHEEMVMQLAFHDALTKLPNRRLLNERLSLAMASSKRSQCYGALLFLDLDNFKPLNDQYGHNVGDLLLVEVASRLSKCVREVDTIARFGGDEFVIVVGDLKESLTESREQANIVAEKILDCLALPYLLSVRKADGSKGNIAHACTVSIGVKLFLDDQETTEVIINQADAAMYQSKARGRGQISFSEQ